MSDTSLRARSVTEIIDAAFTLYQRDFLQYIMVGTITNAPMIVLTLLVQSITGQGQTITTVIVAIIGLLAATFVAAVVARMGATVYLGGRADAGATLAAAAPRLPTLLLTTLLTSLMLGVSFIFLIIPGLYLTARLFAAPEAVVLEQQSATNAIRRSFALTKGRVGHVFLTLLLLYALYFGLTGGVLMAIGLSASPVLQTVASAVIGIFCYPILGLVRLVLYYDLRIRAEGFDVEHMAQSMGGSPELATSGSVAL
jgi:hypothetical protein